jgi:hypothetical protein
MDINSPTGRIRRWIMRTFGVSIFWDRRERARRFLEEAIELVQAMELPKAEAQRLLDRIYSRPAGEVMQEIGGVGITLFALVNCEGHDFDLVLEEELSRIESLPIDHWRKRQAAKAEAGVGVDLNAA